MSKTLKTIDNEECVNFLHFIRNDSNFQSNEDIRVRNLCMCLLMLDAGLRVGELVQLHATDLFMFGQPVDALDIRSEISKSKRSRVLPLSNRLRECIQSVHSRIWVLSAPLGIRFAFHTFVPNAHITPRQVQRIIEGASLCSLGRKITPHSLRHTFATRVMRTSNIRIVQELLGHRSISTTQIYTHPGRDDLKNAIQSLT